MKLATNSEWIHPVARYCACGKTAFGAFFAAFVFAISSVPLFAAEGSTPHCVLVERQGKVEIARKGSTAWAVAEPDTVLQVGDRLRTALRSRATLRWSESSVVRVDQLTSMEIQ